MSIYLECPRKKNRPKIATEVCLKCRHRQACKVFATYQNPPLFGEIKHAAPRAGSS